MKRSALNTADIEVIVPDGQLRYIRSEIFSLKGHPSYSEAWLHDRICEDPSILGLGDVVVIDRERRQPRAGRLDLLLENINERKRFEVEIQLGATDESHIIRTLEYWDIERKRFPQYEHCAVIVAEDITSRFLNVVNLLNGQIPLIALQVKALKTENQLSLFFTRVVDEVRLGYEELESLETLDTDRTYWEERATPETVALVDSMLQLVSPFAQGFQLKYNKYYIGLAQNNQAQNFALFKPQKKFVRIELRLRLSSEFQQKLEEVGIEVFDFIPHWQVHPIKLSAAHIREHRDLISEVLKLAYTEYYSK